MAAPDFRFLAWLTITGCEDPGGGLWAAWCAALIEYGVDPELGAPENRDAEVADLRAEIEELQVEVAELVAALVAALADPEDARAAAAGKHL